MSKVRCLDDGYRILFVGFRVRYTSDEFAKKHGKP